MKKERKDHPVLCALKISAFLLFVVVPVVAWQTGQDLWTRLHGKEKGGKTI
jgi:hypothetical protein|nr:hypothetical protein [uncultured Lachnoclostridium sp.]